MWMLVICHDDHLTGRRGVIKTVKEPDSSFKLSLLQQKQPLICNQRHKMEVLSLPWQQQSEATKNSTETDARAAHRHWGLITTATSQHLWLISFTPWRINVVYIWAVGVVLLAPPSPMLMAEPPLAVSSATLAQTLPTAEEEHGQSCEISNDQLSKNTHPTRQCDAAQADGNVTCATWRHFWEILSSQLPRPGFRFKLGLALQ